jgi:hypothetical protein
MEDNNRSLVLSQDWVLPSNASIEEFSPLYSQNEIRELAASSHLGKRPRIDKGKVENNELNTSSSSSANAFPPQVASATANLTSDLPPILRDWLKRYLFPFVNLLKTMRRRCEIVSKWKVYETTHKFPKDLEFKFTPYQNYPKSFSNHERQLMQDMERDIIREAKLKLLKHRITVYERDLEELKFSLDQRSTKSKVLTDLQSAFASMLPQENPILYETIYKHFIYQLSLLKKQILIMSPLAHTTEDDNKSVSSIDRNGTKMDDIDEPSALPSPIMYGSEEEEVAQQELPHQSFRPFINSNKNGNNSTTNNNNNNGIDLLSKKINQHDTMLKEMLNKLNKLCKNSNSISSSSVIPSSSSSSLNRFESTIRRWKQFYGSTRTNEYESSRATETTIQVPKRKKKKVTFCSILKIIKFSEKQFEPRSEQISSQKKLQNRKISNKRKKRYQRRQKANQRSREKKKLIKSKLISNYNNSSINSHVFNLSNIPLNSEILSFLSLGGKFIPHVSKSVKRIKDSLKSSLAKFTRKLKYYIDSSTSNTLYSNVTGNSYLSRLIPPITAFNCYNNTDGNEFMAINGNRQKYVGTSDTTIHDAELTTFPKCLQNYYIETLSLIENCKISCKVSIHQKQLLNVMETLKHNYNIVVKPADKNLGICILSKDHYIHLCNQLLSDVNVYKIVEEDIKIIFNETYARLRQILHKNGLLYVNEYGVNKRTTEKRLSYLAKSLLQLQDSGLLRPARFYILPKVHKKSLSARPIVSSVNTITYYASRYLHNVLYKYMVKLPTICTSSKSILPELDSLTNLPQTSVILCADVASLYPSIHLDFGLKALRSVLTDFRAPYEEVNLIVDLLEWVLKNNYISFDSKTYLQVQGTAMGTPVAVTYANIVLYYIERNLITKNFIKYYRYIDDIFAVCDNAESACVFVESFNKVNTAIQLEGWTVERYGVFLDLDITITPANSISFTIYQKPMNKYQYLPPNTAHPRHIINNFIKNEISRYRLYCTEDKKFGEIMGKFYSRLIARGYTYSYLNPIFQNAPWNFLVWNEINSAKKLINNNEEYNSNKNDLDNNEKNNIILHPIVVVNIPINTYSSISLASLFDIGVEIRNFIIENQAHKKAKVSVGKTIIARKLSRNIQTVFLHKPLSDDQIQFPSKGK